MSSIAAAIPTSSSLGKGDQDRGRRDFHRAERNGLPYPRSSTKRAGSCSTTNDGPHILDMDGRRTEVVNDIQVLCSKAG